MRRHIFPGRSTLSVLLRISFSLFIFFQSVSYLIAQDLPEPSGIKVPVHADPVLSIDFGIELRDWDGFGVNYVETAQTRNYDEWPQEYGGFGLMTLEQRETILQLIFGEEGLKPGLTKLFLDVWHEGLTKADNDNDDAWDLNMAGFDHRTTTKWLCYFNKRGLEITRKRGDDLTMMTTLYGPPAWATKQKFILGRDLDPQEKVEVAEYIVSWVKYLHEIENLPIKYVSFHNEGDAYYRWPRDASNPGEDHRDYNMWWRPETVVDFLDFTRRRLDKEGLEQVGLTPGETQTWYRFDEWGYARAIVENKTAFANLSLITSHNFANVWNRTSPYYGDYRSVGIDLLRSHKPELHAWVTSMSWGDMDAGFVDEIRRNIYISKVNGLIPWAVIQRAGQWIGGDPNPGTGIKINDDGSYDVQRGYYYYKQVCRAGQPGMKVCHVTSLDPAVGLIAFGSNGTANPDVFIISNIDEENNKECDITVMNSSSNRFVAYRTDMTDRYERAGTFEVHDGRIKYTAPANSVTTFYAD